MDPEDLSSGVAGAERTRLPVPLENRPGVFLVGSPNVGKRTLLSRLLSIDLSDESDSLAGVLRHGWTIDTKYYSADICIWTAQLDGHFSFGMLQASDQLTALVMVFDMNDASSFVALQNWVSGVDLQEFEILLCVGNKADLLPGHLAHVEYRRQLQKQRESAYEPQPEFLDYGISETEGSSLLGEEEPSSEIRKSYMEWCSRYNIEFIEACASNADFDKCLSADGDIQGVERIRGALSAHMWPGMVLKSGEKILKPSLSETGGDKHSDEESDFEVEYERLSAGSDDQWAGASYSWVSFDDQGASTGSRECSSSTGKKVEESPDCGHEEGESSSAHGSALEGAGHEEDPVVDEPSQADESGLDEHPAFENLEQLMTEIGSMRENLRLMPDFQRREAAAKLAMKMAVLFGEDSDGDS
ncbi:unnamed protein product [Spirodela intermedia]|uniref:Uncharacterized protein n=1 Tax=Spirodela intermedia TaxID=51605 RepID=A0A7I8K2E8_SPIIN|nr:unnamed protein product [Spirodela intermedia]